LLDVTLIVALVGASARKRNVFALAIGQHFRVDKLAAIVGIQTEHGKREQLACSVERLNDQRLAPMEQRHAFGPAGGHEGRA